MIFVDLIVSKGKSNPHWYFPSSHAMVFFTSSMLVERCIKGSQYDGGFLMHFHVCSESDHHSIHGKYHGIQPIKAHMHVYIYA